MSRNIQQIFEHIFDRLYAGYGIHIKSWEIIILFSMCRYAQSCAFISVIELPRIPAYCPKMIAIIYNKRQQLHDYMKLLPWGKLFFNKRPIHTVLSGSSGTDSHRRQAVSPHPGVFPALQTHQKSLLLSSFLSA